jgi:myosin heavy chain 9/10/11/14
LEKQLKEVNVRLVDLETKAYAKKPRTSTSAIDERAGVISENGGGLRSRRSSDIALRESSRHLQKAEEERDKAEAQIEELRKTIDKLVS